MEATDLRHLQAFSYVLFQGFDLAGGFRRHDYKIVGEGRPPASDPASQCPQPIYPRPLQPLIARFPSIPATHLLSFTAPLNEYRPAVEGGQQTPKRPETGASLAPSPRWTGSGVACSFARPVANPIPDGSDSKDSCARLNIDGIQAITKSLAAVNVTVNMISMKRIFGISLVLVLALVLAACNVVTDVSQQVDPEKLIPEQANFIAQVKVGEILRDLDFESFYDRASKSSDDPQSFEELLDMALGETGVDLREFQSAILFGDVSREDEFVGAMAEGRFEQATLKAALEEHGEIKLVSEDYKGQEIHVGVTDGHALALGFLSDKVLLIGTVPAVRAVIDVQVGDRPPASDKVVDSLRALGDPLFKMALVVPPETLAKLEDEMAGGGFVPIAFEAAQDLDVVTLVVDRPGADLKIESQLRFTNPDSAAEIGNTLIGFLALAKGFAPDEQTQDLLQKLEIAVEGGTINIRFQAPPADLKEVASGLGNDMSSSYDY